jgi:sugar phosphate isomerase/epimerase
MQIDFFCPRWGSEHLSWDLFCKRVSEAGYNGIEYAIAGTVSESELDKAWNTIEKYKLKIIPQHFDTYEADFTKHFDLFNKWIEKIKPYPCQKINSQTGKDFFSLDQNTSLVEAAAKSGLNIVHETHRNKFPFAAHIAAAYFQKIPSLRITLDLSHWVCVSESYLEYQQLAIDLAVSRTDHIHARVGYPEGPQVPDPRIPECKEALNKHLAWWDTVVERKKQENAELTITPEFGPFPYMVNVPSTGQPVCDQWEVNHWMMEMLRKRYY